MNLSVVSVCSSGPATLLEFHARLSKALSHANISDYEIIFVNEGDDHQNADMIDFLRLQDPLVQYALNVDDAFRGCRGERVFVIDTHLTDPPELLLPMLESWERGEGAVFAGKNACLMKKDSLSSYSYESKLPSKEPGLLRNIANSFNEFLHL